MTYDDVCGFEKEFNKYSYFNRCKDYITGDYKMEHK